jgi:hypothetical protein
MPVKLSDHDSVVTTAQFVFPFIDKRNNGVRETTLVYKAPDEVDDVYHTDPIQVLKYSPVSG